MKRSHIMAARQAAADKATAAAAAAAMANKPIPTTTASITAAATPTLQLPRWNGDMSKKNRLKEERNAAARYQTQAKREGRPPPARPPESMDEEEDEIDHDTNSTHATDSTEQDQSIIDELNAVDAMEANEDTAKSFGMSNAKFAFIQQQSAASNATEPKSTSNSYSNPAAATTSYTISPMAPTISSLPAFSPAKKKNNLTLHRGSGIVPIARPASASTSQSDVEKPTKYYRCNFCPRSNKKHKTYDDGVLIVQGRRCTLKNMCGATIGTQLMSQSTDKLQVGFFYTVGSHEIELCDPLPAAEFESGRVFVGTTYSMKTTMDDEDKENSATLNNSSTPQSKRQKTGHALFNKQPIANKPHTQPNIEAMINDPDILLLNRIGVERLGERAVRVDQFLSRELRPHQREGVQFMYDCVMGIRSQGYEGCILADEMGLGKTLQAITLLWTLLNNSPTGKKGVIQKAIIVCPATLVNNWQKEFVKWLGSHRCKPIILLGSLSQVDQRQLVQDFIIGRVDNVLIVGYELFRKHVKELKQVPNPLLICDEGHRLKSTVANQTIKSLLAVPTRKRIMLTGTPVQNDLGEFYAMCEFVNPSILGNLTTFSRTFMQPINRSRDRSASSGDKHLGEARSKELAQRTQNFVLRRSNDILLQYLPERVEEVLFIPLTPFQAEIYRGLLRGKAIKQVLARSSGMLDHDAAALEAINSLKKLCNHPGLVYETARENAGVEPKSAFSFFPENYVPQRNFADITQSSKLAVLDHLLAAVKREQNKIVVVSNYMKTLDMLATFLDFKKYQYLRLDGSTPAAERSSLVDRFNSSYATETFVFLLSAKAGGVGLNLIGGNRLVLFDPDWNPAIDLQAMSRVWRDGQKHTVYIYRFLCTATIDEKIYQRQIRKQELSLSVAQSDSGSVKRNFDAESLRRIFTYNDATQCETKDILFSSKKQKEKTEEEDVSIANDFHSDLSKALDPLLHSLPSRLVSTFLNRVSSLAENRRALEVISETRKKKLEQELAKESKKGGAALGGEEDGMDEENNDDEDGDADDDEQQQSTTHVDGDPDEGEAEYSFDAAPATSSSAAVTDPFPSVGDEATGAMESEDEQIYIRPSSGKKRRRAIADDEEEEKSKSSATSTSSISRSTSHSTSTSSHFMMDDTDDNDLPDWMRPHHDPSSTSSATIPFLSSTSPNFDSAACDVTSAIQQQLMTEEGDDDLATTAANNGNQTTQPRTGSRFTLFSME